MTMAQSNETLVMHGASGMTVADCIMRFAMREPVRDVYAARSKPSHPRPKLCSDDVLGAYDGEPLPVKPQRAQITPFLSAKKPKQEVGPAHRLVTEGSCPFVQSALSLQNLVPDDDGRSSSGLSSAGTEVGDDDQMPRAFADLVQLQASLKGLSGEGESAQHMLEQLESLRQALRRHSI